MRRAILAVAAILAIAACGDNNPGTPDDAAVVEDDAALPDDAGPPDAAPDAASPDAGVTLTPCLDRPTDLDRPPTGALPCDMLPPGFTP